MMKWNIWSRGLKWSDGKYLMFREPIPCGVGYGETFNEACKEYISREGGYICERDGEEYFTHYDPVWYHDLGYWHRWIPEEEVEKEIVRKWREKLSSEGKA